jgi:hypothetical protein
MKSEGLTEGEDAAKVIYLRKKHAQVCLLFGRARK